MARISNIDTLSAYFDRLVTERIKWFFFKKDKLTDKVTQQEEIIEEIKLKITDLILESLLTQTYNHLSENRTFDPKSIVEELDELTVNDINIGESDRSRLEQVKLSEPNLKMLVYNEKLLRKSNESRSVNKNKLDDLFKQLIEKK